MLAQRVGPDIVEMINNRQFAQLRRAPRALVSQTVTNMAPEDVAVQTDWTIGQILEHIRGVGHDQQTLNVIYVVDNRGRLVKLERMGFVPAIFSAPFVATLVEVTGIVICFSVTSVVMAEVLN